MKNNVIPLWQKSDWNGFFGLFTNVLLNVMVLTQLSLMVLNFPDDLVFGRILPALGLALPIGNLYYAYMAYRLAKKENRTDVTALPYGPSVPHMFVVVFLVMLPTFLKTNDPIIAWQAGLAWCFIIGIIVLIGAFVGPKIRKVTPKAAMLGTLAGISIAFISMGPAFNMFETPWISLIALALILVTWAGNYKLPFGIPSGLAIMIVGIVLGWGGLLFDQNVVAIENLQAANENLSFYFPIFSLDVMYGLLLVTPFLATAIPLGIFNFIEAMNNVESAESAGDSYNLRQVLLADGVGALIGASFGSPFPPAVYIGHPGWKSIGARIGYSMATGVSVGLICMFGVISLLLALIPLPAILPILLYIGLLIGSQAFQVCPTKHAPAIILAFIPSISEWAKTMVDSALNAAGTNAAEVGMESLANSNVLYVGLERLGSGSILSGMLLCSMAVFAIERQSKNAAIAALLAAFASAIGLIHAGTLAILPNPDITVGYVMMAGTFMFFARKESESEATKPLIEQVE